ncbi:riboflavin kinase [Pleomassaria siparia CBS 279.74]|uniref:Riboflavin kinase n=1 Tax=Pleomassaria siparia CBS 279.74 TaxID=1314801 RepID=A0A6G1KKM7_9PLEO|nr:riboflavin kinase [Pleomassaria siparia CBS 279.74]
MSKGRPDGPRDPIAGPSTPQHPFPIKLRGPVIKGFGRGSKDLGIPTANIPLSGLSIGGYDESSVKNGIYYGWATLDHSTISTHTTASSVPSATDDTAIPERSRNHAVADLESESVPPSRPLTPSRVKNNKVYPTVLSIGYNPFYANKNRSIEIHILHTFPQDFYGATLSLIILGFIREEFDYVSKEALVEDIREDIRIAQRSLEREAYESWREDRWLSGEGKEDHDNTHGFVPGGKKGGVGQTGGVGISQMD